MAPERFAHKAAEHWSSRIAGSILSTLNLDSAVILSVYEPNRIRHRAVACCVLTLGVTNGEPTVVLAIFTPIVAGMKYVWGCGVDMAPGMLQLIRGDRNRTRKAMSFLNELERSPN